MDGRIALATLGLWCAGCTQGPGAGSLHASHEPASNERVSAVIDTPVSPPPRRQRPFAGAPDRGDLVAYPSRRVVRHDGAYTWHRANLSEQHALQAVNGVLRITTPAGQRLQFQYERHVEHASGDWTWIGRAKGGAASDEVVLTFGERAAFGSISQPGQAPLKLAMSGGVAWLIETDRAKIARMDHPATRPDKPDYLIPPKLDGSSGRFSPAMESSPTTASSAISESALAAAITTTTIDLLLGYTGGFATAQGGQSQAVTRLNNIVEITNQAYANSQLDVRVRLVHSMQVNYPDSTSSLSTLEGLTGYRANVRTTPDPAFSALRSAREQYGADLVSLVRTASNDTCGLAWLIGAGLSGIRGSDEYYGYSVISDRSQTASGNYYCRQETLAHEIGHNLGAQHNHAASTVNGTLQYGAYPYSFGHQTLASPGGFYTVMAFGDTGQTLYRVFSNPRVAFCGSNACGVTNQADNARGVGLTAPIVAGFRPMVVPLQKAVNYACCIPALVADDGP